MAPLTLHALLSPKIRLMLYLSSLSTLLFVQTYCTNVCPFIDGLFVSEIVLNLSLIFLVHIAVRELLYWRFSEPWACCSLPRQAYYLSIISWLIAGVAAFILHAVRYEDFPYASHLKLLSSYWVLGGGILAQMEYILFEYRHKQLPKPSSTPHPNERISRRILESFILFTTAPTLTLVLVISRYDYQGVLSHKVMIEVLYIGGLFIATSLLIALLFGRMLREDTDRIVRGVATIEAGDFTHPIRLDRPDELGEISRGIDVMAEGLAQRERIKEAFGKFVDPVVVETFTRDYIAENGKINLSGQRRHAVILMADIRNFTVLSESIPADRLVEMLNAYFAQMVEAVNHHGGMVDKFIGDAIMAVFGLTDPVGAEEAACQTALSMRQRLVQLNAHFRHEGFPELDTGVGIHAGEVVAGYLGSQERLEFTVIGSPVNVAARIESETKVLQTPVLISETVARKLTTTPSHFVSESRLKGVSEPVRLYGIDI